MEETTGRRLRVLAFMAPVLLFQTYVVIDGYQKADALKAILRRLADALPPVTSWFFHIYPFLPVIPIIFLIITIDLYRRKSSSVVYSASVQFGALLLAFTMFVFIHEACITPLLTIFHKLDGKH